MCGCKGTQGASGTYEVTLKDGAVRYAKSELEAKVIIVRAGGGTYAKTG